MKAEATCIAAADDDMYAEAPFIAATADDMYASVHRCFLSTCVWGHAHAASSYQHGAGQPTHMQEETCCGLLPSQHE